jgi:hypothetical protein
MSRPDWSRVSPRQKSGGKIGANCTKCRKGLLALNRTDSSTWNR